MWVIDVMNPYDIKYVNSDEQKLDDFLRPRDKFWFRLKPWKQTDKLDYRDSIKNYLEWICAVWWKEIQWRSDWLVDTIIPLWLRDDALSWLPLSTYNKKLEDILWEWRWWYVNWILKWKIDSNWWIIIPSSWTYMVYFYSEVSFDPNIWQTSYMVTLLKWNEPHSRDSKVNATNPDTAWRTIVMDFKAWDVLYLWGSHASASWKKALYLWGISMYKLS